MEYVRKLPEIEELKSEYSLSKAQILARDKRIDEIRAILSGSDKRKIICIGPCSADREDAVLDYIERLARLQEEVIDKFLFIPRVYTSKPRSSGLGYKGLLHRPNASLDNDDLPHGVIAVRKMHLHVIQKTGMFCCDEMLYPEMIYYILDLLAYVTVGACSVEDQGHRLAASGLGVPVGMKNPMNGDLSILLNSIAAAHSPQSMIARGWEVKSDGNDFAHGILRGYSDVNGEVISNYKQEDIEKLMSLYKGSGLSNPAVLIDCNHCNSGKHFEAQIDIAKYIFSLCANDCAINDFVKGIMLESYIEDGCQSPEEGVYGRSVTDACLGWDKTYRLIGELANIV